MFNFSLINFSLTSLEFIHPWWFLALPLPLLVVYFVPAYRTKQSAIKVPFFSHLIEALGESPSAGANQLSPSWWQRMTLVISWVLIITALAKPTILGAPQVRESFGRDVMVLVDLSGSMAEKDFTSAKGKRVSRLDAVKEVLADFVKTREGDRLGLILFGDAAFLQTPFTADQDVWLALLNQTEVAMAGQSTHLGDAMGLAIKVFDQSHQEKGDADREKVAIVLTDGNDTDSFVEPIEAAKVAKAKGVRIHMIAMGDPQTVGETALDMDTINRVAQESGGQAFVALDREALSAAYEEIGKLEPQLYESSTYRPKQSIHHYLIAVVVVMYLVAFSLATLNRRRTSHRRWVSEDKGSEDKGSEASVKEKGSEGNHA
ncbi:VWA domain-containing protein [Photobacterium rosenbergii]|uniref:VWA domain-containing protein n=1 Tax=Photobacterium rosenbergii TaxID=294936 RepID=A0ABU3ZEX1_9GAMM|nr:VWA domain-containing protein [Photobacterium rosenbergii]MDV5168641.1 VWA domain-containing protein [Photobacterium rosenbergii]